MEPVIEVENLCKEYESFRLQNVSFKLPKGSIMGFIGENGAGKTTTIKLILNLISRQSGKIKVMNMDNIHDEKRMKEDIGVVFDESYFHENLTPNEISKVLRFIYRRWDEKLYQGYLKQFNIPADKTIKQLSKGMKMKLSIATALSHHPKVLILDEATSGLDPVMRNEILDLFMEFIQDEEHAILISSHIINDLEKIADYITFIHEGKIVLSEQKDVLLQSYGICKCGQRDFDQMAREDRIGVRKNQFGYEVLVKAKSHIRRKYPSMMIEPCSLEDIMLFYVRGEKR